MPELPEVEVTRLSLAEPLSGTRIRRVVVGKALRWPLGCAPDDLVDRRIVAVRRRGKYLILQLDVGVLLVHLGMSGSLRHLASGAAQEPPGPHDHFDVVTERGCLRLHDPRRFGAVVYSAALDAEPARKLLGTLGFEPLDTPTGVALDLMWAGTRGRRVAIKQLLLAGNLVVGVGNIYASEALFMAGIRPTTPAGSISRARVQRLHAAIVEVLGRAVELGGSSLKDFTNAAGDEGLFQLHAQVYGRGGQPCVRCGGPIRLLVQGQRSTYYCPRCQR